MRRPRNRPATCLSWTLGEFLVAATKQLNATLPSPGKRSRASPKLQPPAGALYCCPGGRCCTAKGREESPSADPSYSRHCRHQPVHLRAPR
ncbi:hypothetical protein ZWY2020_049006 [Hordeum vulgare]|nr:hypothetical protein ZWY2020_049006 [Hordeum vulgare]